MLHIERHPTPEPGCFGCRASGVGFQGLQSRQGPDPVRLSPVIGDDSARGGKTVGRTAEHWDGRKDATVFAPDVTVQTSVKEI